MRARIRQVRELLAASSNAGGVNLAPLGRQQGMFAMLPLDKDQIAALRADHGIYMAGSGRINIAGLTMATSTSSSAALAAVAADMDRQPVLSGERLVLRPLRDDDWDALLCRRQRSAAVGAPPHARPLAGTGVPRLLRRCPGQGGALAIIEQRRPAE
jgi:hypothetical protein